MDCMCIGEPALAHVHVVPSFSRARRHCIRRNQCALTWLSCPESVYRATWQHPPRVARRWIPSTTACTPTLSSSGSSSATPTTSRSTSPRGALASGHSPRTSCSKRAPPLLPKTAPRRDHLSAPSHSGWRGMGDNIRAKSREPCSGLSFQGQRHGRRRQGSPVGPPVAATLEEFPGARAGWSEAVYSTSSSGYCD